MLRGYIYFSQFFKLSYKTNEFISILAQMRSFVISCLRQLDSFNLFCLAFSVSFSASLFVNCMDTVWQFFICYIWVMKYFIFFICVASIIVGLSFIVMYFTDTYISYGRTRYQDEYLIFSAIGFGLFLFTAFYLWKNNFFKRNN